MVSEQAINEMDRHTYRIVEAIRHIAYQVHNYPPPLAPPQCVAEGSMGPLLIQMTTTQ